MVQFGPLKAAFADFGQRGKEKSMGHNDPLVFDTLAEPFSLPTEAQYLSFALKISK